VIRESSMTQKLRKSTTWTLKVLGKLRENLRYHMLKHNKAWFNDKCSKLIDQWEYAKLQCKIKKKINGDNLQNLRQETSRIFKNKKREHLKDKINELKTNNKTKNIKDLYRGIMNLNRVPT
jgi:hypothetical protein